ncbi:hypothetical protein quinque_008259 [Culex quinquefasciatus]
MRRNVILILATLASISAETCEHPPRLLTFPYTMAPNESNCSLPIEGSLNLTLSRLWLPKKSPSGYDFLEMFRSFADCPGCIQFHVHYFCLLNSGAIVKMKIFCNRSEVLQLNLDLAPNQDIRSTLDYSPAGGQFRLNANCTPFAAGYEIELDNANDLLRFDRHGPSGLMVFIREKFMVKDDSCECNCSGIRAKFDAMWECKEPEGRKREAVELS